MTDHLISLTYYYYYYGKRVLNAMIMLQVCCRFCIALSLRPLVHRRQPIAYKHAWNKETFSMARVQNPNPVAGSVLSRNFSCSTENVKAIECTTVPETTLIRTCLIRRYREDTRILKPVQGMSYAGPVTKTFYID